MPSPPLPALLASVDMGRGHTLIRGYCGLRGLRLSMVVPLVALLTGGLVFDAMFLELLLVLTALSAMVGLGLGFSIRVSPDGITIDHTLFWLPFRRTCVPLEATVCDDLPYDSDEPEGVDIGEVTVEVMQSRQEELRQMVLEAVARAQRLSRPGEHPYR